MEISMQIEALNTRIMNSDMSLFPNDLFNGKMGFCIYFYCASKLLSRADYQNYADKLLLNICESVNNVYSCEFNDGLSGIAWGILYLHKTGFVSGNLDVILQEIDDTIFRTIHFSWFKDNNKSGILFLGVLLYYVDRYPTIKAIGEKILVEKTIIYILNHLENNLSKEQWYQPKEFSLSGNVLSLYLLILSRIYNLDVCKNKVVKICSLLTNVVLSTMPLSYANKTFFLLALRSVLTCFELPGWKKYAVFIEDHDPIFYRTKYTNLMANKIITPFLCIWDADIIVSVKQICEAVFKLRTKEYHAALPYSGKALDTSMCIREVYMQKRNLSFLYSQPSKMELLHKGLSLRGGAFIVNTDVYRNAGMENLEFYGWGSEDFERYDRLSNLGYKIYITEGVLFHLSHPRGINSKHPNFNSLINSEYALFKTRVSSAKELTSGKFE